MKKYNIVLNLSNLHGGGGLQVGVSFISSVLELAVRDDFLIIISSEIYEELKDRLSTTNWNYLIYDTNGIKAMFSKLEKIVKNSDVCFTLFGPKYTFSNSQTEIVGFAQPWISTIPNPMYSSMSFLSKAQLKLKFFLQSLFFSTADILVVELQSVAEGVNKNLILKSKRIAVVHNALSSLYFDKSSWQNIAISAPENVIKLGLVSRGYPHKNIKILSEVAKLLNSHSKFKFKFYFTLTNEEWSDYESGFGDDGETVGPISVFQCPSFYQKMDGVIFPSLLECFSATPLEALYMKKPLFASDRSFVRDVCNDQCYYFDPLSPASISDAILKYYNNTNVDQMRLDTASIYSRNFSNAGTRAKKYLSLIDKFKSL